MTVPSLKKKFFGHIGLFPFGVIVNSAATNILVHVFLGTYVCISVWYTAIGGITHVYT